jgi:hypothetical protein
MHSAASPPPTFTVWRYVGAAIPSAMTISAVSSRGIQTPIRLVSSL